MNELSRIALSRLAFRRHNPTPQIFVCSRAFHASTRRSVYSESILILHDLFQTVHQFTGTPWSLTIPLIAVLVRTSTKLPIHIIQQRAIVQQIRLSPLIQAWKHSLQKETIQEVGHLGPEVFQRTLDRKINKKRRELFQKFNCGQWKLYIVLLDIPIILAVNDVLRRMAGLELTALSNYFIPESLILSPIFIPMEKDFALEGMLWFPDLTLPDPHLILPFMLSGAMLLNTFGYKTRQIPTSKLRIIIRRGLGVVALCAGPYLLNFPSSILLYWTSSFLLSWMQNLFIDWFIPTPRAVQPLTPKRPWRTGINTIKGMARKK
ncbi:hypothetical protein K3495_g740 [Podosphaera aphanis]|nr:hypothetical protein K3495_g740 [Podosphaera aphanis]